MTIHTTARRLRALAQGGTPKARVFIKAMVAGDEQACARVFADILAKQPQFAVIDGSKATVAVPERTV